MKLVHGFQHFVGHHCGSTSMRDLLHAAGLALSEEMCFGIGSGLGFFYFHHVPEMGVTHFFHGRPATLERQLCQHLALDFAEGKHDDPEEAWRVAREFLDADVPLMINVELSRLPYYHTRTPFPGHRVVLAGYDEARQITFLADNAFAKLQEVAYADLRAARIAPIPSALFPLRNDWLVVRSVSHHTPLADAIAVALRANAEEMLADRGADRGVRGIRTLASDLMSWRDAPDWTWCARFGYQIIERRGTGGGAFRKMYAQYLREAETRVPALRPAKLSDAMASIAQAWSDFAMILKRVSEEQNPQWFRDARTVLEHIADREEAFWQRVWRFIGP